MLIPAMNSYGTSKILVHQDELAYRIWAILGVIDSIEYSSLVLHLCDLSFFWDCNGTSEE